MAILEMKNVSKAFGGSQALSKIDFSVEEGEIHALLGENGAGKSTLMNILTGVIPADSGSIHFAVRTDNVNGLELGLRISENFAKFSCRFKPRHHAEHEPRIQIIHTERLHAPNVEKILAGRT